MATTELFDSRRVRVTRDAKTAQRRFVTDMDTWEDEVPKLGSAYPDDDDILLVEYEVRRPDKQHTKVYITCFYSTVDNPSWRLKDWIESSVSMRIGGIGARWKNFRDADGNEVPNYAGVPLVDPNIIFCWEFERTTKNVRLFRDFAGKINKDSFKGFSPQNLLFLGGRMEQRRTSMDGWVYRYTGRAMVSSNSKGHNYVHVPGTDNYWDELTTPLYEEKSWVPLL